MNKEGLTSNLWTLVRNLNLNLTARIRTKDGLTRPIKIKDSIRQGGVLSVAQYAILMDEIAKEIKKSNYGVKLPNTEEEIGSLLWVDDVVLASFDEKEMQDMLNLTNSTASMYRVEFGKEKSQIMLVNNKKQEDNTDFTLGEMVLDQTKTYKYLGETVNSDGNIKDHIKSIKGKAEAAFQTIMLLAGDSNFKNIEMETIWKLVETCILPIILYASETWNNNKAHTIEINQILDNIIKRILQTPTTTPRETLYMETGLIDIEHLAKQKQIMMKQRLHETASDLMKEVLKTNTKGNWNERTLKIIEDLKLNENDVLDEKQTVKRKVTQKLKVNFKENINKKGDLKSKVKHLKEGTQDWNPGKRKPYLNRLTRKQASTIFKTRTRMIDSKNNFRNKHKNNMQCRACGLETETQQHILEQCTKLHETNNTRITPNEIFNEETDNLKTTAKKIAETLDKLKETAGHPVNPGRATQ